MCCEKKKKKKKFSYFKIYLKYTEIGKIKYNCSEIFTQANGTSTSSSSSSSSFSSCKYILIII
jgi:hypothetical protein